MDAIDELLSRGVDKIYPSKDALEKALRSGKKLRLYQGFDPSGIQLHIGHMTGLMKLRQFQNLGHNVIFLIGDGTGQAGDPSGKTRTREKFLTRAQLRKNAQDYVMQASKIVRFTGNNAAEILYNGDWLNKLTLIDILDIAGHFSLQYLEERDLYVERKKMGSEINFREFLYPLLQGYDSVAMHVDLELGGSDQTFNMLAGRKLVREMLNKEKYVMTTPLLTDSRGKKIGKTEGNVIALTATPHNFYGMIMSLPDEVIDKCFEYITDVSLNEVEKIRKNLQSGTNPMIYKKQLAFTLTKILNNEKEALSAQNYFEKTFQEKKYIKDENQKIKLPAGTGLSAISILTKASFAKSNSEAKRLVEQGAVNIDGEKIVDPFEPIHYQQGTIVHCGKHNIGTVIIDHNERNK